MKTKKCFKCSEEKPIDAFYKHPKMGDGRLGKCSICTRNDVKENRKKNQKFYVQFDLNRYRNNIERLWRHKYQNMRNRVLGLNRHSNLVGKEIMSIAKFLEWCLSTKKQFMRIHKNWKKSGYQRKHAPSIDRINNGLGYIPGNLQWLTQSKNSKKSWK